MNNNINKLIDGGSDENSSLLSSIHIDSKEYVQHIESKYPGYLYSRYCYYSKTLVSKASFKALYLSMNEKNLTPGERHEHNFGTQVFKQLFYLIIESSTH